MGRKSPEVDNYIANAAPFARPILKHLRKIVHAGCPDVEEKLKWGFPHFEHKGLLCSMAAFQAHATFGFWKGALLARGRATLGRSGEKAMGQFGRITSREDLPSDRTLMALVKRAVALNDAGVKAPARARPRAKTLDVPADFMAAVRKNKRALATFEAFSPSCRREYVEWVTEAKRADTRARRLATAVAWMADGKVRNWKYVEQ